MLVRGSTRSPIASGTGATFIQLHLHQNDLYSHFRRDNDATGCACFKMNNYGMGSDLHTFGQALWNMKANNISCFSVQKSWIWDSRGELFNWPWIPHCKAPYDFTSRISISHMPKRRARAQALAFSFAFLRPSVYTAARNASNALHFSAQQINVPLVTVHIRWSDKWQEMKLFPIEAYINAVNAFNLTKFAVYVATEDVNAIAAFKAQAPKHWTVYAYLKGTSKLSSGKNGRPVELAVKDPNAGFHALISLLVGLQSSHFVVSSGSNWSRLILELCLIDSSKQCTVTDLSPNAREYW